MEIVFRELKTQWSASGIKLIEWADLKAGDQGSPFSYPWSNRVVQISGDFGVGGSLELQGALIVDIESKPSWIVLKDKFAKPLIFTAALGEEIRSIAESTLFIRPIVSGGDSETNLTVRVMLLK